MTPRGSTFADRREVSGLPGQAQLKVWRRKLEPIVPAVPGAKIAESLEEEVRRLRREVTALREDREILKKASAFFAKELR